MNKLHNVLCLCFCVKYRGFRILGSILIFIQHLIHLIRISVWGFVSADSSLLETSPKQQQSFIVSLKRKSHTNMIPLHTCTKNTLLLLSFNIEWFNEKDERACSWLVRRKHGSILCQIQKGTGCAQYYWLAEVSELYHIDVQCEERTLHWQAPTWQTISFHHFSLF